MRLEGVVGGCCGVIELKKTSTSQHNDLPHNVGVMTLCQWSLYISSHLPSFHQHIACPLPFNVGTSSGLVYD
jgi:hypothetical protein